MTGLKLTERNKERAIIVAVAVVCVFAAFSLLIKPGLAELRELHAEVRSAKKTLELYRTMEELDSKIKSLEKNFTTLADRPLILAEVSDLASKEKINVQGIAPQAQEAGQYTRLQIAIDFTSTFSLLTKYLKAVEEMTPVLNVSEISILKAKTATQGRHSREIQSKLVLETLLLQKSVRP